jgi:hypothetical protein
MMIGESEAMSTPAPLDSSTPTTPVTFDATPNVQLSVDPTEPDAVDHVNWDVSSTTMLSTDTTKPDTLWKSESTTQNYRPTIIGVSIGVSLGFLALGLLFYILRRYREHNALRTPTAHFPPDHIYYTDNQIIARAELDTAPNAIAELQANNEPIELDGSEIAIPDLRNRNSVASELEGSAGVPFDPNYRNSVSTSVDENRWSNVSSLAPSQAHRAMAGRPSVAESLSIVSQQHHGSGQDVFLTPPRPRASHRLSRPTSGLLPDIELPDDGSLSTPKSSSVAVRKQDSNDTRESCEREQVVAVPELHEGKQSPVSETAYTSDEAPQAGKGAQAGENSHQGETANEGEVLRKSGTDAQAGEVIQASEITSEVEAARKSEDSQQSDVKLQAAQDMQAGKKAREGETAREIATQTHNSEQTR